MPKSYKASAEEQSLIDELICPFCQSDCVDIHIILKKQSGNLAIKITKGMSEPQKPHVTKLQREQNKKGEPIIDSFNVSLVVCRSCRQCSAPKSI